MVLTIMYLEKKLYKRVCVTIGNPAFCITLYLTGVHFRGKNVRQKLQHVRHVDTPKVTARWSRGSAKNEGFTNQNSRNSWCQIVRGTICKKSNLWTIPRIRVTE